MWQSQNGSCLVPAKTALPKWQTSQSERKSQNENCQNGRLRNSGKSTLRTAYAWAWDGPNSYSLETGSLSLGRLRSSFTENLDSASGFKAGTGILLALGVESSVKRLNTRDMCGNLYPGHGTHLSLIHYELMN